MREEWTGELIGKMHNNNVTFEELAKELNMSKGYISMILNGSRTPSGAREKLEDAFSNILQKRAISG
jgi:transcriptional regulator with XRE-family HTH domain